MRDSYNVCCETCWYFTPKDYKQYNAGIILGSCAKQNNPISMIDASEFGYPCWMAKI